MADQKRWFKVWTSLLVDMDHVAPEIVGHWTRLGCRIALVGTSGTVIFEYGYPHIARFLNLLDNSEIHVREVLNALPGVTFEESKTRYGEIAVTMTNWVRYQVDSTYAERQKKSRSKRREEEKRKEERRGEENTEPQAAPFLLPDWIPKDSWEEFAQHRKRKRAALTDKVAARLCGVLEKLRGLGYEPAAVLAKAIDRNWTAFEVDWIHKPDSTDKRDLYAVPSRPLEDLLKEAKAKRKAGLL